MEFATRPLSRCVCALGLALASMTQATAADRPALTQPLWELGVGLAWVHLPHYRGSDQSRDWVLPVPYAVYRGKILRATREGARAVLFDSERFDLDVSVSGTAPTRSSGNRARAGMADLPAAAEIGPNLNATLARGKDWKVDLRMPVHAVFSVQTHTRALGYTVSPVINLDTKLSGWSIGLQAGPRWASGRYHDFYYGVGAADATASRPAYTGRSGQAGWRLTTGASRRLGDYWLGAFVRADGLDGANFLDSPLVRQRHNLTYGLVLSWVAKVSDERVAAQD